MQCLQALEKAVLISFALGSAVNDKSACYYSAHLFFSCILQTAAMTGTLPPPVHKIFRK